MVIKTSCQGKSIQNVALILSVLKFPMEKLIVEKRLEPFPCLTSRFYEYYESYCGTPLAICGTSSAL